jgi:glycosyltransferase involved in cell wall biosynthesis
MKGADALMLPGVAEPGGDLQVPNKLVEYIAVDKPIIATAPATSAITDLLESSRADAIVCAPGDIDAMAEAIRRLLAGEHKHAPDANDIRRFDRSHGAAQLATIFDRLAKRWIDRTPRSDAQVVAVRSAPRTSFGVKHSLGVGTGGTPSPLGDASVAGIS